MAKKAAKKASTKRAAKLDLSNNVIADAGVLALAAAPLLSRLTMLDLTANQVDQCRPTAPIRHMNEIDSGQHLEELAGQMLVAANAARRHRDLARIGFGIGNELGNSPGRYCWMYHQNVWIAKNASDRR